jgi:hypothetical protein
MIVIEDCSDGALEEVKFVVDTGDFLRLADFPRWPCPGPRLRRQWVILTPETAIARISPIIGDRPDQSLHRDQDLGNDVVVNHSCGRPAALS